MNVANDVECFSLRNEDSGHEVALLVVPIRWLILPVPALLFLALSNPSKAAYSSSRVSQACVNQGHSYAKAIAFLVSMRTGL